MPSATNSASKQTSESKHRPYRSKGAFVADYLPQMKYEEMGALAGQLLEQCPAAAMHLASELQKRSGAILLTKLPKGYKYRVLAPDGELNRVRKFK